MSNHNPNSPEHAIEHAAHRLHRPQWPVVELVSAAAAGVAGVLGSWLSIGHNFYKNMKEIGAFRKAVQARDMDYEEAIHRNIPNKIETIFEAEKRIEGKYRAAVDAEIQAMGVKNQLDKWKILKPHQKWETALATFTISAVTLGAVFSMGRHLQNKAQEDVQRKLQDGKGQSLAS